MNESSLEEVNVTHNPDVRRDSENLLLGSYRTKASPVLHLHYTRRNLLLAVGPFQSIWFCTNKYIYIVYIFNCMCNLKSGFRDYEQRMFSKKRWGFTSRHRFKGTVVIILELKNRFKIPRKKLKRLDWTTVPTF